MRLPGFVLLVLSLVSAHGVLPAATTSWVEPDRPAAVVVLPARPVEVVRYAAEELVKHVERATGVRLVVVQEEGPEPLAGRTRLYLGNTLAARQAGVNVSRLGFEDCVLRTVPGGLVVAGQDDSGDPLDADTNAGTLWGVYEMLERVLKVRWLWPGDAGVFVPQSAQVAHGEVDEVISPRFFQRRFRPGLGFVSEHPAMGFTKKGADQYAKDLTIFLRRHRMGRSYNFSYGHAFTQWWDADGKSHPEWFQYLEKDGGRRGPSKKGGRFSMCVSNAGLQQEIVDRWLAKYKGADPRQSSAPRFINAVENDILGLCACAQCKAADGPPPENYLKFYAPDSKMIGSRFVSDRYARFWLGVQQRAAAVDPAAHVVGYVYFNYFDAPTSGVKLNPRIVLGYCPSAGWFPRAAEEHAWMKQVWSGWSDTGARLFMRTNHFLDGYCMPFIFAHQFADEFHHAEKHGMVATDYDSLTGHWATQGPNLYLALRLHTRPQAAADELLAEYYGGFGAAAPLVKQYFDHWEAYTTARREAMARSMVELQASRWRSWARAAHAVYPESCFAPGEALLRQAEAAASEDAAALGRVKFLQLGLEHARLCARISGRLSLANPLATAEEAKQLISELLAFRRRTEGSNICNFNHLAWLEDLSWKLGGETRQTPDLYP